MKCARTFKHASTHVFWEEEKILCQFGPPTANKSFRNDHTFVSIQQRAHNRLDWLHGTFHSYERYTLYGYKYNNIFSKWLWLLFFMLHHRIVSTITYHVVKTENEIPIALFMNIRTYITVFHVLHVRVHLSWAIIKSQMSPLWMIRIHVWQHKMADILG